MPFRETDDMDTVSGSAQLVCPHCGASNSWDAAKCWVCRAPLGWDPDTSIASVKASQAVAGDWTKDFVAPALLVVGVVATIIGLAKESPGLAILLALVFAPGLLFTLASASWRKHHGRPMSTGDKVVRFLFSVAMTVGILIVVTVVAVVAFIVWLFVVCTTGNFH